MRTGPARFGCPDHTRYQLTDLGKALDRRRHRSTVPTERDRAAIAYLEQGHARGKVVIDVD
jgi:hypothetical protein